MVFCYHNCSNVLWEKIVLVWGKKIEKRVCKFEAFRPRIWNIFEIFFLTQEQWFPQLVRNVMVTDYFFVYSDFFQWKWIQYWINLQMHTRLQRNKGGHTSMAKYFVGGFEGTLWQICKILRYEKPYFLNFPSYIIEIMNFQLGQVIFSTVWSILRRRTWCRGILVFVCMY